MGYLLVFSGLSWCRETASETGDLPGNQDRVRHAKTVFSAFLWALRGRSSTESRSRVLAPRCRYRVVNDALSAIGRSLAGARRIELEVPQHSGGCRVEDKTVRTELHHARDAIHLLDVVAIVAFLITCLCLLAGCGAPPRSQVSTVTTHAPLYSVGVDGKTGFIDRSGVMVIPPTFEEGGGVFTEGLASCRMGDKYGFIDHTGTVVIPAKYDDVQWFSEGYAPVTIRGRVGFVDRTGALIIQAEYDQARPFSEGRAAVQIGWKWGFLDAAGTVVIPPEYDSVTDFSEGLAGIRQGDRAGVITEREDRDPAAVPVRPIVLGGPRRCLPERSLRFH